MNSKNKTVLYGLLLCCLINPVSTYAQATPSDSEYLRMVDAYAHGKIPHATDAFLGTDAFVDWPNSVLEHAVRRALGDRGINRKAAVMLHTESAFGTIGSIRSAQHLSIAQMFLDRMSDPEASAFKSRWQACVEILKNVLRSRKDGGEKEIARLLGESDAKTRLMRRYNDPKSGAVEFAAGLSQEIMAAHSEHNLRGEWLPRNRMYAGEKFPPLLKYALSDAIDAYQHALAKEPDLLQARLRLGWLLLIRQSWQPAREQLDQVIAGATAPNMLYLAHLFKGALEEGVQRPDAALQEYKMAYTILPGDAAAVALMRAEALLGLPEPAQQVATELAERTADDGLPDPWHLYIHGVIDDAAIEELRAEARTP